MNLHIKDKFKFVDLATLGSRARRYVKPYVLVADPNHGMFGEGDLLDANGTYNLIKELSSSVYACAVNFFYTQEEYEQALEQGVINKEDISIVYDEKKIYKDDICMDINSYIERIASLEDRMTEAEAAIDDISKKSDLLILS